MDISQSPASATESGASTGNECIALLTPSLDLPPDLPTQPQIRRFNKGDLKKIGKNLKLSDDAVRHITHQVEQGPVRKNRSNRGVTGYFASSIMDGRVPYASHSAELGFLWRAHHPDARTRLVVGQPTYLNITTKVKGGAKTHTYGYPPDYLWVTDYWAGYVECKWDYEIEKITDPNNPEGKPGMFVKNEDGRWTCPPGEAAAAEQGLGFAVFVMKKSEVQLSNNLEFVADYHDEPKGNYFPEIAQHIRKIVRENPGIQIRNIQDEIGEEGVDTLFFMVARRELAVDLANEPLSPNFTAPVYIDRVTARAHEILKQAPIDRELLIPEFDLEVGTSFVLHGKPARIVSRIADVLTIQHADLAEQMLVSQLEALVESGKAVSKPTSGLSEEASKLYLSLKAQWPRMIRRNDLIRPFLELRRYGRGDVRTNNGNIYRLLRLYREAQLTYGEAWGILGLRDRKRREPERQADDRVIAIMHDVIDHYWGTKEGRSKEVSWGEVCRRCKRHKPRLKPPSRVTFYLEIARHQMETGKDHNKERYGERVAKALAAAVWEDDWDDLSIDGEHVWSVVHIDHTQADSETAKTADGFSLGRPWLTVMVNPLYRRILAVVLSYEPPSYRSCMQVIRECVQRHKRLPRIVVTDGGRDFRSNYFGALLTRFGIHQSFRPPAAPRYGTVLERLNLTLSTKLFHNILGGTKAMKQPRNVSKTHQPRELAIYTLPQLADLTRDMCYEKMDLEPLGVEGISRRDAFNDAFKRGGPRSHKMILYNKDFIILTLPDTPSGEATCSRRQGIMVSGIPYWCRQAKDLKNDGKKFPVKYDPDDFSRIYVLMDGEWRLCRSRKFRRCFKGTSEKEIKLASIALRAAAVTLAEKRRAVNATTLAEFFHRNQNRRDVMLARLRAEENRAARLPANQRTRALPPAKTKTKRGERTVSALPPAPRHTTKRPKTPTWQGFGGSL